MSSAGLIALLVLSLLLHVLEFLDFGLPPFLVVVFLVCQFLLLHEVFDLLLGG